MEDKQAEIFEAFKAAQSELEDLKADSRYDGRSLAIAITHLETARLWFVNSIKVEGDE